MESSRDQVCVMYGVTWLMVGPGKAEEEVMSSIQSSVKTRLQASYGLRLPMKWGNSRILLRSSSLVHSVRGCSKGTLDRDFCLRNGHFPSIWKWGEGPLLRLFSRSNTEFSQYLSWRV